MWGLALTRVLAIRRLFSIEVIASVQDKVSTIQSSEVSTNQRFFKRGDT